MKKAVFLGNYQGGERLFLSTCSSSLHANK